MIVNILVYIIRTYYRDVGPIYKQDCSQTVWGNDLFVFGGLNGSHWVHLLVKNFHV